MKFNEPEMKTYMVDYSAATIPQLSNMLRGEKAEKAYYKKQLNELGKVSLGNINSVKQCLISIQRVNMNIKTIKYQIKKKMELDY